MYTLRISHRYDNDNWFISYEYLTKEECYDYVARNYDIEEPDSPYRFEIIDCSGNIEVW